MFPWEDFCQSNILGLSFHPNSFISMKIMSYLVRKFGRSFQVYFTQPLLGFSGSGGAAWPLDTNTSANPCSKLHGSWFAPLIGDASSLNGQVQIQGDVLGNPIVAISQAWLSSSALLVIKLTFWSPSVSLLCLLLKHRTGKKVYY